MRHVCKDFDRKTSRGQKLGYQRFGSERSGESLRLSKDLSPCLNGNFIASLGFGDDDL